MIDILRKRIPQALLDKNLAVMMGGHSSERDFSLRSGLEVTKALDNLGLNNISIELDENSINSLVQKGIDFVFLATHGVPGEDGVIQGALEQMGVLYTSAGVEGSVLALDKLASKALLEKEGILTPQWEKIDVNAPFEESVQMLMSTIGFPLIVKPPKGGSSIGVRLCQNVTELRSSLEQLSSEHSELFAEKYIQGRELTVSVLEDTRLKPYCLPILELSPKNLFYDYESKWEDGKIDFLVPAKLESQIEKELLEVSLKIHKHLKQRDVSRSDFILSEDNQIYYLETNSIPGYTQLSDLPAQAKAHGMSFEEVVLSILLTALQRQKREA
jgi:D-alanine-D-alanine ligase